MNIKIAACQPSTAANFTSYLTGTHTVAFEEHVDQKTLDAILQEFLDCAMQNIDHAARDVFIAVHSEKT